MSKRRSLNEALDVNTELQQFIEQGKPDEDADSTQLPTKVADHKPQRPRIAKESPREDPLDAELPGPSVPTTDHSPDAVAARPRKPRSRRRDAPAPAEPEMLVPLTTRIQRSTSKALTRAYLEQKLNGHIPATQQAIVEEALHHWLKSRGYL